MPISGRMVAKANLKRSSVMNSHDIQAGAPAKKPWKKPEVRRIVAGAAENGSNTTTNGDAPSGGTKS